MRVALVQVDPEHDDPLANVDAALRLARPATADLIVFPELFATGYRLFDLQPVGEPLDGPTVGALSGLAREKGCLVVAGVAEREGGCLYNTAVVVGQDGGLVASYRKVHLFGPMGEPRRFRAGSAAVTFDVPWCRGGLLICYDLRFPELSRLLVLAGATVLVVPAQWPSVRAAAWHVLNVARAIEGQVFVLACNRVGTDDGTAFGGGSLVVDPFGEVVARGDGAQGVVTASIDLDRVAQARKAIPALADRRTDLYGG